MEYSKELRLKNSRVKPIEAYILSNSDKKANIFLNSDPLNQAIVHAIGSLLMRFWNITNNHFILRSKQVCHAHCILFRWLSIGAVVLLASGCVSTDTYDQLNRQYKSVSAERDSLAQQVNELQGNTKVLQNKVATTEQQNADIKAQLDQTTQQLNDVNKDLEARTAELKQTNDNLSEAQNKLNSKNAELASTSAELQKRQQELQATTAKLSESDKKLKDTANYMSKTNKLYDDLVKELSTEVKSNKIKIKEMKDGISVNLSEDILFPSGSADLNKKGVSVIKKVSTKLKGIPHQIIVAGFTDNIPIKGGLAKRYPTNWELAGARAASVVRVLEASGVDAKKMTAVSYGDNEPVASNDTADGRAQNRRIEIRLRPVK